MTAWALMCIIMAFVKNYAGLMAVRSALGLAEGGYFPGVTFYITMWYRRHECGLRMAWFFSAATAAGAFGGLLARGIMEMDGIAGLASWQWIFLIEGLVTLIVGLFSFFAMHDYPDTAGFLNDAERSEVRRRLEEDRCSLADDFHLEYVWDALKDWKIWVFCFITTGIFTPLYCISLFLPTIVKGLGYTNNSAQLMTVPPYAVACVCCIAAGFAADRTRQRGVYVVGCIISAIIGSVMLFASHSDKSKYAGTFFLASGIYPNVSQIVAWNGNNIGGSTKRGVGIAMQVMAGSIGGIMSAYMYLPKDAPLYRHGHAGLIAINVFAAVLSMAMSLYLRRENARRDMAGKDPKEYSTAEKHRERRCGDSATFFRYTT